MALTKCKECGNQLSTAAAACPHCGAPQADVPSSRPPPVQRVLHDRTESTVVQVAPSYENERIKEMEAFGWTLRNRQEIHEEGEAYGRPSYIDSSTYVVKTTVYTYVKLHFARSLSLPNLERIRELEGHYFSLPFPEFPRLLPGGWILLLFWYPFWPIWYFWGYKPKRAAAEAKLGDVIRQQQAILQEVAPLLSVNVHDP